MRRVAIALLAFVSASCSALGGSTGPNEWWLIGTTPDAQQLLITTQFGGVASGCSRWEDWAIDEAPGQIRVEALVWRQRAPSGCTDDAGTQSLIVELQEPLDERELVGCQRERCGPGETWPDSFNGLPATVRASGDTVMVALEQAAGFDAHGALKWTHDGVRSGWLFIGDEVAVGSDGGIGTVAMDPSSGDTLWEREGFPLGATDGVVLLCVGDDAGISGVDEATGHVRWSADVACGSADVGAGAAAVVAPDPDVDGGQRLVVLDPQTGEVAVDLPVDDGVDDQVAAYGDVLLDADRIILGGPQGDLVVLGLDGTELLRVTDVRGAPIGVIGNSVILADHQATTSVDMNDGQVAWRRDGLVAADVVIAGDLLLGLDGPGGQLERIDPVDGTTQWTSNIGITTRVDATLQAGALHVATSLALIRLDTATGQIDTWAALPPADTPNTTHSP